MRTAHSRLSVLALTLSFVGGAFGCRSLQPAPSEPHGSPTSELGVGAHDVSEIISDIFRRERSGAMIGGDPHRHFRTSFDAVDMPVPTSFRFLAGDVAAVNLDSVLNGTQTVSEDGAELIRQCLGRIRDSGWRTCVVHVHVSLREEDQYSQSVCEQVLRFVDSIAAVCEEYDQLSDSVVIPIIETSHWETVHLGTGGTVVGRVEVIGGMTESRGW